MTDTMENLRRKMSSATDLRSVVRTMKILAASRIGVYEQAVHALVAYNDTVSCGLGACLRARHQLANSSSNPFLITQLPIKRAVGSVIFGSDQGLVGQFNDHLVRHAMSTLGDTADTGHVWVVGERAQSRLVDMGLTPRACFSVPSTVTAIDPLVEQLTLLAEKLNANTGAAIYIFHHRPTRGHQYEPVTQRLLPLDTTWAQQVKKIAWPNRHLPEIDVHTNAVFSALLREYIFISLYRACAESLMSENASRLAAMERAEKNINELTEQLHGDFHRRRQSSIDEELFDVIAGYESQACK